MDSRSSIACKRKASFNEAAPLRERMAPRQRDASRRSTGFNEAAPLRERMARNASGNVRAVNGASMRPLP